MPYTVVQHKELGNVIAEVNKMEQAGWRVQGGVMFRDGGFYAQAMVKAPAAEGDELTRFYAEVATRYDESTQHSDDTTSRLLFVLVSPAIASHARKLASGDDSSSKNISSAT